MTSRDPDTVRHVQPTTVRFTDEQVDRIRREAKRQGVSAAQLIREATISWLAYIDGRELEQRVEQIERHLGLKAP